MTTKDEAMQAVEKLLSYLETDSQREGLKRTPQRVIESWDEIFSGYKEDAKDMVIVRDIEFFSLCEHHLIPFFGKAHVGYIPNGNIIGLSKIPKIIEIFSKRLQVQENLTNQISSALDSIISPHGLGVVVEARHTCSIMRGDNFSSSNLIPNLPSSVVVPIPVITP